MKLAVVGLGYVGLPVAILASLKGYDTTGIDLDEAKVKKINQNQDPIHDHYVAKYIKKTKLKAATNPTLSADCKIVIVCVPTPVKNGKEPDLAPLKNAVKAVAENIKPGTLIIIESTVNPGVCDEVVIPLIEGVSGLKVNSDFWVSHCPERINPGDLEWNIENIPRVAGSSNQMGLRRTIKFYSSLISAPIKPMGSLKEAESVKIIENAFRDINIAFVNELAMSFTKLGVDVKNVIDGAATKPFAFMPHYPSIGVGGHCIPVDPYYLIEYARGFGFEHEFLSLARKINSGMPKFTVERLVAGLKKAGLKLKGTKVTVLGLSYKPNVADDRESPSYRLVEILLDEGAKVTTYDPYLPEKSSAKSFDESMKDADAVVVATNHRQFENLKPKNLTFKVFVDGKNSFERTKFETAGIIYEGIGR